MANEYGMYCRECALTAAMRCCQLRHEKRDFAHTPTSLEPCVFDAQVDKETMDQEEFMHEFSVLKAVHDAGGHPNIAGELSSPFWPTS